MQRMRTQGLNEKQPLPIAAIVLAAGQGSRMGGGKLLLPLIDSTVIERTVQNFLSVPVSDLVVVIGVYGLAIKSRLQRFPIRFAFNLDPLSDMAESIRCGLKIINPAEIKAFLIMPADMPLVLPETIRKIIVSLLKGDKAIALPVFQNRRGHPVVFRSNFYEKVLNFRSPQGIRPLVHDDPSQVLLIEVEDEGVILDLDNWDDYRWLLKLYSQRRNPAQ
ncbi:MAG: nucleotidyltransferase family protein [Armatimonadetes bacterium]|nr:nucleotidyltransferase family protein [Armatimonadota bacterium]MDW8029119.1 nucleotidyltransferase family protein [Armatimonadota bacterium]